MVLKSKKKDILIYNYLLKKTIQKENWIDKLLLLIMKGIYYQKVIFQAQIKLLMKMII